MTLFRAPTFLHFFFFLDEATFLHITIIKKKVINLFLFFLHQIQITKPPIPKNYKVGVYTKVYVIRPDCLHLQCESSWQLHISIKLLCYNTWTQCMVYILNNILLALNYSKTNRMLSCLFYKYINLQLIWTIGVIICLTLIKCLSFF